MLRWAIIILSSLIALSAQAQTTPVTQCVTTAVAGGTGDAITIPTLPCIPTTTLLILTITSTNATTQPTIKPPTTAALPIVTTSGASVGIGVLVPGYRALLSSNGASWFLLNAPANVTIGSCASAASGLVPATGGGTGNILRADCTFTNSLVSSLTGAITPSNEGAAIAGFSEPGVTAQQITNWVFCNCVSPVSFDAVRGVAYDNGGQTIDLVNGVAGYVVNNSVFGTLPGGFPTGVALFGVGIAAANGSNIWGVNTAVTDNKGQVASSGTGKTIYGAEFDTGATSPSTVIFGAVVQGASIAQPSASNGFICGPLSFANSAIHWGSCLQSDDDATQLAINIGLENLGTGGAYPPAPVAEQGSQLMQFGYQDVSNNRHEAVMQASIESGNGGGNASFVLNSDNSSTLMGFGLIRGGFWTGDNSLGMNGLLLGALAASGDSVNSQLQLWKYFDNTGTAQNISVFAKGGSTPILEFNSTAGTPAIQMGGNIGLSCSGPPTSSFASVGGIVTHC